MTTDTTKMDRETNDTLNRLMLNGINAMRKAGLNVSEEQEAYDAWVDATYAVSGA